jgi:hypothetical protein
LQHLDVLEVLEVLVAVVILLHVLADLLPDQPLDFGVLCQPVYHVLRECGGGFGACHEEHHELLEDLVLTEELLLLQAFGVLREYECLDDIVWLLLFHSSLRLLFDLLDPLADEAETPLSGGLDPPIDVSVVLGESKV